MVFKSITLTTMALVLSSGVNAALLERLGGLAVYDTDRDITWLADTNAGAGSNFDDGFDTTDGIMTWESANAWAESLSVGGFTDWRLPTTLNPDFSCQTPSASSGLNCIGSEMGHLFYNEFSALGNTGVLFSGDASAQDKFTNLMRVVYWSRTIVPSTPGNAFLFGFGDGGQGAGALNGSRTAFVWAVRSGDVNVVPVPAAVWLFGSGLLGLISVARRKKL